ncbi:hypothetical protein [Phytoactinopolyspora endophytica]|uniref:hypothetical protein n=1 Tax=Phytoactinopolyspora endophytica TaxID=1642495 RepID=UPI0013E9B9F8|nr:hypothetical protein [Phytoactinopolyspora endophytica]
MEKLLETEPPSTLLAGTIDMDAHDDKACNVSRADRFRNLAAAVSVLIPPVQTTALAHQ